MYIGKSPRSLDALGKIIVVDKDAKLLRTLSVPSPSMPNFADFNMGIYISGLLGEKPAFPISFSDLEAQASDTSA